MMVLEKMRCLFSIFPIISTSKPMKMAKTEFRAFIYGDMDNEVWNTSEYEIDLVVDSLYFVHDLEKTISNLFKLIKNKRIAIIYYTEYGFNIENENWKDSKTNKLGKVLESKNIKYEYLDITERELGQWEKCYKLNKNLMINLKAKGINLCLM